MYLNKTEQELRLGNFPETGKQLNFDNDKFIEIINSLFEPLEENDLINHFIDKININHDDAKSIINYLFSENIIIDYSILENMLKNKRLSRQNLFFYMLAGKFNENYLNIIKTKKILILGLGGIGSITAELLARAGFESFALLDFDKVELSNLIRQMSYTLDDIGKPKTDCLAEKLLKINNNIKIKKYNLEIKSKSDISHIISDCDFVINTLDKPIRFIRGLINECCVKFNKPVIFAGFAEHVGMVGPFIIPNKTACLNCIDKNEKEIPLNEIKYIPSFGPLCNIISSILSTEVLNYYINFKPINLEGKTLMFNIFNYSITEKKWTKNKNCKVCGDLDANK